MLKSYLDFILWKAGQHVSFEARSVTWQ